jgi:hypothetical protein
MTDDDIEKIIKQNMNLQMNLAGIRADFEEASQRSESSGKPSAWVGLTDEEIKTICLENGWDSSWQSLRFAQAIEAKLKERNVHSI